MMTLKTCDKKRSASGVALQRFAAPYAMNFNSLREFNYNTVYDANQDPKNGSTWQYDSQYKRAMIRYHAAGQADDWLFSPNIRRMARLRGEISG